MMFTDELTSSMVPEAEIESDRVVSQCQSAVAEAVEAFGRIDVLLGSTSEGRVFGPIAMLTQHF